MIKYCLPIIEDSKDAVINSISLNPDYDFYEIWLAYIKDLDTDFVWKLSEQYNGKLIFLFRKQNLEKSEIDKQSKEKIIKLLESSGNFLDLDINEGSSDLDFIKANNLENKLITSMHDYKETPSAENLEKSIEKMKTYKPEIYKVSAFCKSARDSLKLLTLLLNLKEENKKFLVFGMGEEGRIVRIYGALWGNEFNFAPASETGKSAEGQMTKKRLEEILGLVS